MRCILTVNFSPWSAYSGGGQRSTHNLALALSRRGHAVSVVYTRPPWEEVLVPPGLPYELCWAALPARRSRSNAFGRPLTTLSVAHRVDQLLRERGPAIVHANGEEAALVPALRAKHRFGFVVTPRYPAFPASFRAGSKRSWAMHTKYALLGRALHGADLWCPTSQFAADQTARVFQLPTDKQRVVYNGVSDEFFHAADGGTEKAPGVRAVFFGRLAREKGVETLIEAMGTARAHVNELVLVGRGPEETSLRARAKALGIQAQLRFVNWLDAPALADLVRSADFAVLPSFEESFGNAMAEAMALGVPVISTTAGSIPELVVHEHTGLLVAPGDAQALAQAMLRLAKDRKLAQTLGAEGRARVHALFSWDKAAASFERHYETLLP